MGVCIKEGLKSSLRAIVGEIMGVKRLGYSGDAEKGSGERRIKRL